MTNFLSVVHCCSMEAASSGEFVEKTMFLRVARMRVDKCLAL